MSILIEKYEACLEGFDRFVENLLREWNVPGAALAIIKDGDVIYSNCFGMRDPSNGLEINEDTLFRMASNTKAFVSMSLGILVDEGKLDLDKPFIRYIPWFKMYNQILTEHLTPRDAMSHRSGLPSHGSSFPDMNMSRKEIVERLQYLEPNYDIRTTLQYNSLMYVLCAYLVEHITGASWESFVQSRILDPLGMKGTNFSASKTYQTDNHAVHFYEENDKLHEFTVRNIDPEFLAPTGPSGSICSNLNDMIRWVMLHVNKGVHEGKRIISEESLYQILKPNMLDRLPIVYKELGYLSTGQGWFQHPFRGYNAVEHMGFFGTQLFLIPEENVGVVYLPTLSTGLREVIPFNIFERLFGLDRRPWNERYKADVQQEKQRMNEAAQRDASNQITGTRPSHPLRDYVGTYEHPAYGKLVILDTGDVLRCERHGFESELRHYHYDTFEFGSAPWITKITFHTDMKGNISSISAPMEPEVSDIIFARSTTDINAVASKF